MIKKSKLDSAKLKIDELKEKYSKNLNNSKQIDRSPTNLFNYTEFKVKELSGEDEIYHETRGQRPANKFKGLTKINVETNNMTSNFDSINIPTQVRITLQNSNNKQLPYSSSAESISELSNKFEHTLFVLSDKHSSISQSSILSTNEHSTTSTFKSDDTNVTNSLTYEKNMSAIEYQTKRNIPTKYFEENNQASYVDEQLHTEAESPLSSIKEAISSIKSTSSRICNIPKTKPYMSDESSLTTQTKSYLINFHTKKEYNKSEKVSVLENEGESTRDLNLKSYLSTQNSVNDNSTRHCKPYSRNLNSNYICNETDNSNNSDDLKSSCSLIFKENCKQITDNKIIPIKKAVGNTIYITDAQRKRSDIKRRTNHSSPHHNFSLKPATKNRSILKSCKLLRYEETNAEEFEALVNKANYITSKVGAYDNKKGYNRWAHPDEYPEPSARPTFDPLYGYPDGREPKAMPVSEAELESCKVPYQFRTYCADKYITFLRCRADNWPLVYRCHHEMHAHEDCEYQEYIDRMKDYEREHRLMQRAKRIALKANAA